MKVSQLINILQAADPENEVLVSTVEYYEKNHYVAGYRRGKPYKVEGVTIEKGSVAINGGKERLI